MSSLTGEKRHQLFGGLRKKRYLCGTKNRQHKMGTYINIGNAGFKVSRNSEYIDK